MKFFVDTGDLAAIRSVAAWFPIAGFTTNPKILAAQGQDAPTLMAQYRDFAAENNLTVFFQVTGKTAEEMHWQALELQNYFGKGFVVKIPAVQEGYRAVKLCKQSKIPVLVTAVHSVMQALVAAESGAEYVAPYVTKIDDIGADGIGCVKQMVEAFRNGGYTCQVLGASFRTVDQVQRLAAVGCPAVTMKPELFAQLISHPATDAAMANFEKIWVETYGDRQISDLLPL